jgi:hypothetical protein
VVEISCGAVQAWTGGGFVGVGGVVVCSGATDGDAAGGGGVDAVDDTGAVGRAVAAGKVLGGDVTVGTVVGGDVAAGDVVGGSVAVGEVVAVGEASVRRETDVVGADVDLTVAGSVGVAVAVRNGVATADRVVRSTPGLGEAGGADGSAPRLPTETSAPMAPIRRTIWLLIVRPTTACPRR